VNSSPPLPSRGDSLADAGDDPPVILDVVVASQRELPADSGFKDVTFGRCPMAMTCNAQPAPRWKSGRLRNMHASFTSLVTISPFFLTRVVPSLPLLELPLGHQLVVSRLVRRGAVLLVGEVRAVTTATWTSSETLR